MGSHKNMENELLVEMEDHRKGISYCILFIGIFFITSQSTVQDLVLPKIMASEQNETLCQEKGGTIDNSVFPKENYRDYCLDLGSSVCEQINGTWKTCITDPYNDQESFSGNCVFSNTCILFDQEVYRAEIEHETRTQILVGVIVLILIISLAIFVVQKKRSKGEKHE